jgi:predicted PurR-regulated permease PerM
MHLSYGQFIVRTLIVAAVALGVYGLWLAGTTIGIISFAGLLAICIAALTQWAARQTSWSYHKMFAALLLLSVLLVGGVSYAFGTVLKSQVANFTNGLPAFVDTTMKALRDVPYGNQLADSVTSQASTLINSSTLSDAAGLVGALGSAAFNVLVIVIIAGFVAYNAHTYKRVVSTFAPTRIDGDALLQVTKTAVVWWMLARIVSMVLVGVLTYVGLWLLGIPFAFTLAVITALISFVPNIGPILSVIPAALVALSVGPAYVLYVGLLYLGIQTLESNFLTPIIQERAVSTPPGLLLALQLLFAVWLGIVGLLLAAPLLAVAIAVYQQRGKIVSAK